MSTGLRRGFRAAGGLLAGLVAYDVIQRRHAILRNFPVIGHLRYLLESVGPELRQYIVTGNDDERPFSRNERRWIYATAKRQDPHFGFGSDLPWERQPGHIMIKHAAFPLTNNRPDPSGSPLPCAKVIGAAHGRRHAFRPRSAINVSGMSFGALGAHAVEAMSRGCAIAGALQNTGEGGISRHHLHGSGIVFQIGTAHFGCRDRDGRFSLERLVETVERHSVKAIEIKLSQGAKPGVGALLPAAKVTAEIAAARGIPAGVDCHSPSRHSEFSNVAELLEFIERIADATGLPVGIKSAVGELDLWRELATRMARERIGPDFITIDGSEGGTGAGPLVFTDHVALPFRFGIGRVFPLFAEAGVSERIAFQGSGKLGLPQNALLAFALGCDLVAVGREAMISIGCIQAQRCHTGRCPTGITTHNPWLQRGLVPERAAGRLANYITGMRAEMLRLARTCGVDHPALVPPTQIDLLEDGRPVSAAERFGYEPSWGLPSSADRRALIRLLEDLARARPQEPAKDIATGPGDFSHLP